MSDDDVRETARVACQLLADQLSPSPHMAKPFARALLTLARRASAAPVQHSGSEIERLLATFKAKHEQLHREWTAAVGTPGYVKSTWRERDNALVSGYREKLTALGYPKTSPMLPERVEAGEALKNEFEAYRDQAMASTTSRLDHPTFGNMSKIREFLKTEWPEAAALDDVKFQEVGRGHERGGLVELVYEVGNKELGRRRFVFEWTGDDAGWRWQRADLSRW